MNSSTQESPRDIERDASASAKHEEVRRRSWGGGGGGGQKTSFLCSSRWIKVLEHDFVSAVRTSLGVKYLTE